MEVLPDFDIRLLRSEGDLQDAPLFVLREEEVDLYLQWLSRDKLTAHEVQQLRKVYYETLETVQNPASKKLLLPGQVWYSPFEKQVEEVSGLPEVDRNTPYATEQLLRTQAQENVWAPKKQDGLAVTLEHNQEVLYDMQGYKQARFPKGTQIHPDGYFIPGAQVLGLDALPTSKDFGVFWKSTERPLDQLDIEAYRALAQETDDESVTESDTRPAALMELEPEPLRYQENTPLALAQSVDMQAWKEARRYEHREPLLNKVTVPRPYRVETNTEEYGVTAGEIVGQYDILREAGGANQANLRDLSALEREILPYLQLVIRTLQMPTPTSEKLLEILEMGTRDIPWDPTPRLPLPVALPPHEVEMLLKNPRLALQKDLRDAIEEVAKARKVALQRAILQALVFWSVDTSLRTLEQSSGATVAQGAKWSYSGFPFRKKDPGLMDRVAEILHGDQKLPVASDSALYLAKDMREIYMQQFADQFTVRIQNIERRLQEEKSKASDQLKTALGNLVAANKQGSRTATAAALVRVLHKLPSLLQLEKLSNLREVRSQTWYAYGDLSDTPARVLQQIHKILRDLSILPESKPITTQAPEQEPVAPVIAKVHAGFARIPLVGAELESGVGIRRYCEQQFLEVFGREIGTELFSAWQRMSWQDALRMVRMLPKWARDVSNGNEVIDMLTARIQEIQLVGDIFDMSVEVRWKLGALFTELCGLMDPTKVQEVGKHAIKKLGTILEADRDTLQMRINKLREQMKKNMLDYLDRLSDEDKAAVREISRLGINVYNNASDPNQDEAAADLAETREPPALETFGDPGEEPAGGEGGDYEEFMNENFDDAE